MYNNFANYYAPKPAQDERIWVPNEIAAESYLIAPNSFVRLWDSNKPVFYERRADASGRPMPIEAYSYDRIAAKTEANAYALTDSYQEQINAILGRIEALEKRGKNDTFSDDSAI